MKYHFSVTRRGFSLVEVLVAISILLLVMVGPMRVLTSSNNSTAFSSEQFVAYSLAQEGLELVQLGRDNLVLANLKDKIDGTNLVSNPWQRFQTSFRDCLTTANPNGCLVFNETPLSIKVMPCNASNDNCRLYLNNTLTDRDRYTYSPTGNTETPYRRVTNIKMIAGPGGRPQGAKVTSTVTWRTGSLIADQKVELTTYLTNVYDTP